MPRSRARDDDRLMDLGFSGGKACSGFPSCLLTGAGREPGRGCEAPPTGGLLWMPSVSCAIPSPGRWKKRSIRTHGQLQNRSCLLRGLGAAPSTRATWDLRASKNAGFGLVGPTRALLAGFGPCISALTGGISSNEKRGRLHILLLIIRIVQFDGSVNDTFHNGQILLRAKL